MTNENTEGSYILYAIILFFLVNWCLRHYKNNTFSEQRLDQKLVVDAQFGDNPCELYIGTGTNGVCVNITPGRTPIAPLVESDD